MSKFVNGLKRFVREEEAPTMVEYGLLLALIAVVCIGVITTLGQSVLGVFTTADGAM